MSRNVARDLPSFWVVYDHPNDYPASFVARRWLGDKPTGKVLFASELNDLRTLLPAGLCQIVRYPDDDPVIVESWL